jgi:hypothetical protein
MSLSRVLTDLYWEPNQGFDARAASVISDVTKVRLDPADYCAKLRLQSTFLYPLDADLYVRTPTARPGAVRRLLMIHVTAETPEGTSVGLRIWDGAADKFWDGAGWETAGPGDWNTEAEVSAHLPTLPVIANRAFAVTLNLLTTDAKVTPVVSHVAVLWEGEVDWLNDLLLDSLTATVQEEAIFPVEMALPPLPADATSIDLTEYRDEADLTLTGAEAVYDHAADPGHLTDLLASYNPGTKVLTLSGAGIPAAGVPFLRMRARAQVAWDTNQDWEELGTLPQVVLRDAETVLSSFYPMSAGRGIVRKDTGDGVEIPAPFRSTFRIEMEVRTNRSREQARLLEALTTLLAVGPSAEAGPFLRSRGTDRRFRIHLMDQFNAQAPALDDADVRTFRAEFRLEDLTQQLRGARDASGVRRLKLSWSGIDVEEEVDALLRGAPVPTSSPETFET